MAMNYNVAAAPKDTTFQVRINSEIKKAVEDIYAKTGMTLTDAFNTFIQQSLNVEGLPFIVTKNSKEALKEQALAMLMLNLKRAEERADREGIKERKFFMNKKVKVTERFEVLLPCFIITFFKAEARSAYFAETLRRISQTSAAAM